jgi:hypothetical protein
MSGKIKPGFSRLLPVNNDTGKTSQAKTDKTEQDHQEKPDDYIDVIH